MEMIENMVLSVHVLAALSIIGLVLIQQGKGAEMGSGFGSGASNTVFGSAGAGNFLTRATTIIVAVFFVTSLTLAYFASEKSSITGQAGIPQIQVPIMPSEPAKLDEVVELDTTVELPVESDAEIGEAELPEL